MAKLKLSNEWWTAPAQSDDGRLVMVTGRRDMEPAIEAGVYNVRIEISWHYDGDASGMPLDSTARLMEQVTEALADEFLRDPVAILTGIYTGAGERNWVFYVRSLHIFQRKINEILAPFEQLPLEFYAEEDPTWDEYREMRETEIPDGE